MSKVIYLKSLFKGVEPDEKVQSLIKSAIIEANGLNPVGEKDNFMDSREFILRHTDSFLQYAIDYSLSDVFRDYV